MLGLPASSLLLAPLVVEGQTLGALQVGAAEGGRFGPTDLDLVSVLAQQLSAVLTGSRLIHKLRDAQDRLRGQCDHLRSRLGPRPALEEMTGQSAPMQQLRQQVLAVAPSKTTVLILGETGSGKELVARAVHENSPRAAAAFAAINCSALASGLLESELFGHVRGAFTGAHRNRKGLFEVADGGSLFLDEVGDMPAELQPKLLRVLEQGEVTPVGSHQPIQVDVRVICATHRDLEAEAVAGRFRQDLLFRINVFCLGVPALRQRSSDILPLAVHFLRAFATEHGRPTLELSPEAVAALQAYDWPGNVRELKNEMERAALLAPADRPIERACLTDRVTGGASLQLNMEGTLKDILDSMEASVLQCALQRYQGNRTHCAKALGISRQALIAKIQRLGVVEDP
jgi:Nif-specific regulatory protein